MRRIIIAVILGMLACPTAGQALAAGPQVTKTRELNCLLASSASSRLVTCRGVLAGLVAQADAGVNSNRLPYDEFGLAANQPSQPRIGGTAIPTTGPAVTGLGTQTSVSNDGTSLPYDEFGLAANQPSQPQVGSVDPR
jgi:hypothetical protein